VNAAPDQDIVKVFDSFKTVPVEAHKNVAE
jgi:hypothetical protein